MFIQHTLGLNIAKSVKLQYPRAVHSRGLLGWHIFVATFKIQSENVSPT